MSARKLLKKAIKTATREVLGSPLFSPLGKRLAGQASCLMYHRVFSKEAFARQMQGYSPNRELAVSVERFNEQMEYVSKNYRCISLPQAIQELKQGCLGERSLLVTFDDGYQDNLTQALPVLKAHGVPATIYLTTSMVDGTLVPWWYEEEAIIRELEKVDFTWNGQRFERDLAPPEQKTLFFNELTLLLKQLTPASQRECLRLLREQLPTGATPFVKGCEFLTWDEVLLLAKEPLITLGAHTKSHFVSTCLSEDEFKHEAGESRRLIEERIGRPVTHFAYPFGAEGEAREREFKFAESCGFESSVTTRTGHISAKHAASLQALPRIVVGCHDGIEDLKWKLGGFDSSLRQLGGLLAQRLSPKEVA